MARLAGDNVFRPVALLDPSLLLPLGLWPALALLLGTALPTPTAEPLVTTTVLWQASTSVPIVLDAPNPCSAQPARLDAVVHVRATTISHDNAVRAEVDASFENTGEGTASDRLIPIREQFGFVPTDLTAETQLAGVRRVDVPLTDRLSGSHLAVTMASTVGPDGQVAVQLAEARLVCDPLYSGEPTPQ